MSSEIKQRTVYLMQRTDKVFDGTDVYVGSTSKTLRERLWDHRGEATRIGNENNRLYRRMREVGVGNWEMISLLSTESDKKTILELEMEKCNELNADLNTYSPISGFENKKDYFANYRELNKQKGRYHCETCGKFFGVKHDLQIHFNSLKHSYAYMNSLD